MFKLIKKKKEPDAKPEERKVLQPRSAPPPKKTADIRSRFEKKKKAEKKNLLKIYSDVIDRIGVELGPRDLNKKVLYAAGILSAILSVVILTMASISGTSAVDIVVFMIFTWTLIFVAFYLLSSLVIFFYFDMVMFKRARQMEESLPDFLQLASANISAGMTIDRALWYAVRSRFGVLSKEMESVAKATIAGEDLSKALMKLSSKYESRVLKESLNLIIAGINSGGEMAELLTKISSNIQETKLMKKEISASVMTYVIFIGAAAIVASPLLFALSTELLHVISSITSKIHIDKASGVTSFFAFDFSSSSISTGDFQAFAILVLIVSSFFSAAIVSVIRKGSIKGGLKLIPIFAIVSIVIYYVSNALFKALFGGLF